MLTLLTALGSRAELVALIMPLLIATTLLTDLHIEPLVKRGMLLIHKNQLRYAQQTQKSAEFLKDLTYGDQQRPCAVVDSDLESDLDTMSSPTRLNLAKSRANRSSDSPERNATCYDAYNPSANPFVKRASVQVEQTMGSEVEHQHCHLLANTSNSSSNASLISPLQHLNELFGLQLMSSALESTVPALSANFPALTATQMYHANNLQFLAGLTSQQRLYQSYQVQSGLWRPTKDNRLPDLDAVANTISLAEASTDPATGDGFPEQKPTTQVAAGKLFYQFYSRIIIAMVL